jgi:hypothetical protein
LALVPLILAGATQLSSAWELLEARGAIIVGKTNTPEMGARPHRVQRAQALLERFGCPPILPSEAFADGLVLLCAAEEVASKEW